VPVDLMVLVAAMIPAPGEPPNDYWANTGFESEAGDDDDVFLHDVPADLAAEALRRVRDQSDARMGEPWPLDRWPDTPTKALLCRDDRFFTPDYMRRVIKERLGIEADEVDGGHCVALSRPKELTDRLLSYI
jgi:pimeloyl-ACP methyl ester carboxylesterase